MPPTSTAASRQTTPSAAIPRRPLRLLFCTTDGAGAFNGINAWLLDFLPALAAAGHEVSVLVFAWSPAEDCHTYPRLRERGIAARVVFPRLYTEAAVRRCLREVARGRPDVFIASHVLPALLALPELRAHGVPGVSILHNDDAEYRAKAGFPADATVAVSRRLLGLVPGDGRLARFIPYGVPPAIRAARPPAAGGPFRLVYHGRIACAQKRIVETAAALARVCRADPRLHADLYGSGPDEAALREQLARDDAAGRVRFLGPRDSARLRELLPDYHASVLLSDFEGLPVSVLEAMSAGLVPVCLRIESGLPELIRPGVNGCLVRDREEDFSAAVAGLASDAALWERLSEGARDTVRERFSIQACAGAWEDLFSDLRARPPRVDTPVRALPPPHPELLAEDTRHPGLPRAAWRWLRFGPRLAPRPW